MSNTISPKTAPDFADKIAEQVLTDWYQECADKPRAIDLDEAMGRAARAGYALGLGVGQLAS